MKNIRYYIFWGLDFLKGSPLRKHFDEIKNVYQNNIDPERYQQTRLESILSYARQVVPYYSKTKSSDLKNFPVLTKSEIKENIDELFSSEFIRLKDSLHTMHTSGSTGTPFTIWQNIEKVRRNKADLLFFYSLGNYHVGSSLYFMRIWNSANKKKRLEAFLQNIKMFDVSSGGRKLSNRFILKMKKRKSPKYIMAYASTFIDLMNFLPNHVDFKWNIKAIFTGAEELPVKTKEKMIEAFGCPVISRYSNQENGILAQQPSTGENYFVLNEASYLFEFLKLNSDTPADEGELARIVITDFYNRAVPMIRYDTGDLGVYKIRNRRKYIESIEGRKYDFLTDNDGNKLAYGAVTVLMWKYDDILQYQLVQETLTEFQLSVVHRTVNMENTFSALQNELITIFGPASKIKIKSVPFIPLGKSGKRKFVISKLGNT